MSTRTYLRKATCKSESFHFELQGHVNTCVNVDTHTPECVGVVRVLSRQSRRTTVEGVSRIRPLETRDSMDVVTHVPGTSEGKLYVNSNTLPVVRGTPTPRWVTCVPQYISKFSP